MQSLQDILYSSLPLQCASSGASSEIVYTPQVKNNLIPKIDQVFDSLEDVHKFYNDYAKEAGFGIRAHSSKLGKDGQTIKKEFVCYKQGLREKKYTQNVSKNTIQKRRLTRENCGAKLTVVKRGARFVVTIFIDGHSHPLATPRTVHLIRSHRKLTPAQRALTEQLGNGNVSTHQAMSILEMQCGGLENVGCSQQDIYNAQRDKRKRVEGHDAELLLEYFEAQQEKNPAFTFSIKPDDDVSLLHCFLADATSRNSYKYFGDVVVFDTTYQTNKYDLIFTPIVGVNHHGHTTLFACALLSGEKIDAFEWLFKQWLEAMSARPPKIIITDQDPAMTKTIAALLPNTLHRYCIWHILSKFSEKISALSYKQHYDEFRDCIWNSESPEEFEGRWVEVVAKAKLSTNEWLHAMYEIRERWFPAFTRHIFSAHMTSSQRAEGSHAFYKRYVSRNNTLFEFVTQFKRALSHIRHNELDADHKVVNEKPLIVTKTLMESTMRELYTHGIFYKFQQELLDSGMYMLNSTYKDEHWSKYNVLRTDKSASKGREVSLDKSSNYVKCSCKKFECDRIPCRHLLAYFNKKQIVQVPDQYILRRWTKSANVGKDALGGKIATHDKRNCPVLLGITSADGMLNDEEDEDDENDDMDYAECLEI